MIILESERLQLRTFDLQDIDSLYCELFSDPEVVNHTFGQGIRSKSDAHEYLKTVCNSSGQLGLSVLVDRETDQVIGLAGVLECRYLQGIDYEFGFILGKSHWGKGYATEIGQAQIDFIREILHAPRAIALTSSDNHASIKTIKRLGLDFETIVSSSERGDRQLFVLNF